MKILKLLNKKFFSTFLALFFIFSVNAEDQPVDIWNIDKKQEESSLNNSQNVDQQNNGIKPLSESDIFKMQTQKKRQFN